MTPEELFRQLANPMLTEELSVVSGTNYVLVESAEPHATPAGITRPACPIVGIGPPSEIFDVCIGPEDVDMISAAIDANPFAAAALVQVLRNNESASIADGLVMESLTYSTLQQSAGFRSWLENQRGGAPSGASHEPLLLTERSGEVLTITLNRPEVHNAYSADLKDALCEALHVPLADCSITSVILRGNGRSFCAGGDLKEFGAVTDAGEAHASRTTRSAAPLIAELKERIRVEVHGACIGAGIELPAFAGSIAARQDAFFQLPEVAMGLIPGAGGTVSITKKIGRQKTAYLALSNERIDAGTALEWGLIDELLA